MSRSLGDLKRDPRDEKLWRLLPPHNSHYSAEALSDEEMLALVEALGDGFGEPGRGRMPNPTPKVVKSGLLKHPYFVEAYRGYRPDEDDEEECTSSFWSADRDDELAPSETFPLGFDARRLRVYFVNQFERFHEHLMRGRNRDVRLEDWIIEDRALAELYRKPWYEAHALQYLDFLDDRHFAGPLASVALPSFAGVLGRLVEQYYWRFSFEAPAIAGIRARGGASSGGASRAQTEKQEQARWQRTAEQIWTRNPSLSKSAVARAVKKRLNLARTAKHVARYISAPAQK